MSPSIDPVGAGFVSSLRRPDDLPVEQPTRWELVINLKTAKALGIAVPQSMRLQAERVIERRGSRSSPGTNAAIGPNEFDRHLDCGVCVAGDGVPTGNPPPISNVLHARYY